MKAMNMPWSALLAYSIAASLAGGAVAGVLEDTKGARVIAAQPVALALHAFARERGIQVVYLAEATGARTTRGAPAGLSLTDTLDRLLDGTGLAYEFINDRTVRIFAARTQSMRDANDAGAAHVWLAGGSGSNGGREVSPALLRTDDAKSGSAVRSPAAAVDAVAGLEVIVVTARKTEESLQDAPVAISAFTAERIEEQGLRSIDDLAKYTPGLSFSQASGRTIDRPVIRGQSNVLAGFMFGVESGTAYFIDGVYYPGDIQGIDFNSLERVEVVKGPQSALYGRNTYAGAINFITRAPAETLEASVKATVAEFGEQDYSLSIGTSFLESRLGARMFARSYEYGGEYRNELTGKKVGQESTKSVGLSLNFKPTDNLTILANGFFRSDDDGVLAQFTQHASKNNCMPGYRSTMYRDPPGAATSGGNPNQYFCGELRPGTIRLNSEPLPVLVGGVPQVLDGTAFDGVEAKESFNALRVDWDIGGSGWMATALGGHRDLEKLFGSDDYSDAFVLIPQFNPATFGFAFPIGAEPVASGTNRHDIRDSSVELRIASPQHSRLRAMLGYYHFNLEDDYSDLTFEHPRNGGPAQSTETIEDDAVFGLIAFDISERLTVTGEVRYMEETKQRQEYCAANSGNFDYNFFTNTCTNLGFLIQPGNPAYYSRALGTVQYSGEVKFTSTTPRFTVDWKLSDSALLYGIYARGAKPGGLNGIVGLSLGTPEYAQEESDNYELGLKWVGFDNRVRFNAAGFYIRSTDVQAVQALTAPGTSAGTVITMVAGNQGEGEILGTELELQAAVTEALTISGGYAYSRPEFTKGCDEFQHVLNSGGTIYNPALGTIPECDVSGNRYPLGSEHAASASLNYEAPVGWGDGLSLIGNLGVTYEGSKYIQVHNLVETGDTTLMNLRLGVRSDNGWSVVVFGRNLTDEDTIPLGTRWFDMGAGALRSCATYAAPCVPTTPAQGTVGGVDTGAPRAFVGALRRGRTFGLEFSYKFKP